MAFGDLLEQVGSTGRFQVLHVTLLCVPMLMIASHNLLQNFVAAVPPHYCRADPNISQTQFSQRDILTVTVPLDQTGKHQSCRRYVIPQWHLLDKNGTLKQEEQDVNVSLQGCLDGWAYNLTGMTTTIIAEWDLVCDLRSFKQMGQTVYMGGVVAGSIVLGSLADKFGRCRLLIISHLLMAVAGSCAAFSTSFSVFCLCRFGCGMAVSGVILNTLSLIVEWIPTRGRTGVGTLSGYCYTVGQLIQTAIAYYVRDWRWLTFAVSSPFYVFFIFSWWFHESSRWLVLRRNFDRAIKNLKSVAKINGRHEEGDKIDIKMVQEYMKNEISCSQGSHTVLDLFRTPTMRTMTICLSAVWLSTSFAYYGLAMDLQKFGVDFYLIQVIFAAVDIPAKVIVTLTMSFIGRRPSQVGALIIAGLTVLINLMVPYDQQTLRTSLAVVGKGCLAASFSCCFLYSGELFPTIIRMEWAGDR
ncbi:solute carrier family 22 member 6-like isoform X2 [Syngnathoides biaculeatus]|uniref:solute carrier family 22 member 6-like isoform X2 n=1 Tax=Syngnathoides biaculeatus TaxID=300417 RepID=UPI002ADE6961|nr:solute carrier family 22 member 6-like isoform X2 [Syngnathoides biaculeatus]